MAVAEWNAGNDPKVSAAHLRYLNPFPKNTADVMSRFAKVLVPELNLGQLALLLRGKFGTDVVELHKVQGRPFTIAELTDAFRAQLEKGAS